MDLPIDIAARSLALAPDAHVLAHVGELAPAAPEPWSTFALHAAGGHATAPRDRLGNLEVRVGWEDHDDVDVVIDGLYIGDRAVVHKGPSPADRAWIAEAQASGRSLRLYRVMRIATVTPARVSAWIGQSSFSEGAAHAMNDLGCGTWSVASGERLRLSDVLGPTQAAARLAALTSVPALSDRWYELGLHELDRVSWPGPDTENFLVDGAGGVILCMPVVVGPGGETWLWHL